MKKRIFAASMASVMALSSVSVVAFADETKDFGETVTKAELKEYVKTAEKFFDEKAEGYGTKQYEQFDDALTAAKAVVDNDEATSVDVVATYQMLKGVWEGLDNYTLEDLKSLVNDNKGIYDKDNNLNEDDKNYKLDKYKTFKKAYENADDLVNDGTTDQRDINDAYVELDAAVKGLEKLDRVTKSEFRSVYNEYVHLVDSFKDYEDWRRGKATVGGEDLVYEKSGEDDKTFNFKDKTITFVELKDIIYGASNDIVYAIDADVAAATKASFTAKTGATTWLKFGMSKAKIADDAKAAYDEFVDAAKYSVTTNVGINTTYNTMKKAVEIFKGWKVDGYDRGSRRASEKLIDQYHDDIVKAIGVGASKTQYDTALAKVANILVTSGKAPTIEFNGKGEMKIKEATGNPIPQNAKIFLNEKGYMLDRDAAGTGWEAVAAAGNSNYVIVEDGDDLTQYVPIDAKAVDTILDSGSKYDGPIFSKAYTVLEAYQAMEDNDKVANDYSEPSADVILIDTNKTLTDKSAKTAAYPMLTRALQYALEDNFKKEDNSHTKKDVANLIKDAEKLLDETGDSAKFKDANKALDGYRKAAVEWVAEANAAGKKYEDGKAIEDCYDGSVSYSYPDKYSNTDIDGAKNSSNVYDALKGKYDALHDEFVKYPVSFGDIADTVADIAEGLENNAYGASTETIAASLAKFARDLSTLEYSKDCEAFDDDRVYMYYNRLNTDGTDGEKALYADYNALLTAVKDATAGGDVVLGDLDGDGKPTAKDALLVLKAYAGLVELTDAQKKAADFNGDGFFNAKDATAILKAYAGIKE